MARRLITARLRFANGNPAASLTVSVLQGRRTLATGQTGPTGRFEADIGPPADVPPNVAASWITLPTPLRLRVQDAAPNFFETPLRANNALYVLPPAFDPPEPPSNPHPVPGSDADIVDLAVTSLISPGPGQPFSTVNDAAPGHVMCIRKNGNPWVSVPRGLARLAGPGINQRAMTDDTIIAIASMSKPITATAVVAMIDDWAAIRTAFLASLGAGAPKTTLHVKVSGHDRQLPVPTVLVPLFSDIDRAGEFIAYVPSGSVADGVKKALHSFVNGKLTVADTLPATPPGYFGLLKRGVANAAPAFSDPVWPLIKDWLSAGFSADPQAAALTIEQFLVHMSGYRDADNNSPPDGTVAAPTPVSAQLAGQRASFDLPGFIAGLMVRTPQSSPAFKYANANYIVLTALVEACTETSFDDYLTNRLLFDLRFNKLRRHVVDPDRGALYYDGIRPGFTGGTLFSDFTDFPGHGGVYVTANQFTDWLYALFARQPVARQGSDMPQPMVVSDANFARLFNAGNPGFNISTNSPFFGVGLRMAGTGSNRFQENGGAGLTGFVNGNLAIIVAPGGATYTALFVANGNLTPVKGADGPWDLVVAALPWS